MYYIGQKRRVRANKSYTAHAQINTCHCPKSMYFQMFFGNILLIVLKDTPIKYSLNLMTSRILNYNETSSKIDYLSSVSVQYSDQEMLIELFFQANFWLNLVI